MFFVRFLTAFSLPLPSLLLRSLHLFAPVPLERLLCRSSGIVYFRRLEGCSAVLLSRSRQVSRSFPLGLRGDKRLTPLLHY